MSPVAYVCALLKGEKDNMGETVDVLVVGALLGCRSDRMLTWYPAANYGSGSRGGGVSTLICAVVDDRHQQDDDEEPK